MRGQPRKPHCPKCQGYDVDVTGLSTRAHPNGDKSFRAHAACGTCKHAWLSKHPHLLRKAKAGWA